VPWRLSRSSRRLGAWPSSSASAVEEEEPGWRSLLSSLRLGNGWLILFRSIGPAQVAPLALRPYRTGGGCRYCQCHTQLAFWQLFVSKKQTGKCYLFLLLVLNKTIRDVNCHCVLPDNTNSTLTVLLQFPGNCFLFFFNNIIQDEPNRLLISHG